MGIPGPLQPVVKVSSIPPWSRAVAFCLLHPEAAALERKITLNISNDR